MEVSILGPLTRLVLLLLLFPLCWSSPSPSPLPLCKRLKLEDAILSQCPYDDGEQVDMASPMTFGILEVNGTTLERSLQILQTREGMYAAVLVYARWCPFSRALLPMFDSLSSAFPSIYHFAVEETVLQPSAFSHFGVHSFPALFLRNKTSTVRYHGSRTYEAITEFYRDFSGLRPVAWGNQGMDRGKIPSTRQLSSSFLERKLYDEVYLTLSIIFLILRVLYCLMPRLLNVVKQHWPQRGSSWQGYRNLLRRIALHRTEQKRPTSVSKCYKGKSSKIDGKVALSLPGWPSSSLNLTENCSRAGAKEDASGS